MMRFFVENLLEIIRIALLFLICTSAAAQTYTPGQQYFGSAQYCEYRAGNLPIIITAPHGGRLEPSDIPDRNCAGCTTVMDANTLELALQLDTALRARLRGFPHVVVSRLHRRKLDPNREIVEAANGNATAERTWREFHQYIIDAKKTARADCGRALLIDLHGHGHPIPRLELGYLLSESQLRQSDATINTFANRAAIRYLAANNRSSSTLSDLLRGPGSLGTLLEARGYPSVPSSAQPNPLVGEEYFDGGYITARHGSRDSLTIDAIQIECNNAGVRNTYANRRAFSAALADAIARYLEQHYPPFACGTVDSEEPLLENNTKPQWRKGGIYLPNPPAQSFRWQIIDVLGRMIKHEETAASTNWIDLPTNLPEGLYWWQYMEKGKIVAVPFQVLR